MSKHTPGPWVAAPFSSVVGCPIIAQPGSATVRTFSQIVAVAGTRSAMAEDAAGFRAEVEANARLVAAAPELLEALKRALNFIENTENEIGAYLLCGDVARAAIAKAEGRE